MRENPERSEGSLSWTAGKKCLLFSAGWRECRKHEDGSERSCAASAAMRWSNLGSRIGSRTGPPIAGRRPDRSRAGGWPWRGRSAGSTSTIGAVQPHVAGGHLEMRGAEGAAWSPARGRSAGRGCSRAGRSCRRRTGRPCRRAGSARRPWARGCGCPARRVTRPSRCRPISCLSLVASAWKSTRITRTSGGSAASTRSAAWKGQSTGGMKTRPSRVKTATRTLLPRVHDRRSRGPGPRPDSWPAGRCRVSVCRIGKISRRR